MIAAMGAFGYGVYRYLRHLKNSALTEKASAPHKTQQFILPGTLVIEQGGALYRLQRGVFTPIANGGWIQPAVENREFRDGTAWAFDRQNLLAAGGRSFEDPNPSFRHNIDAFT